jgi:phage terminase large subunit
MKQPNILFKPFPGVQTDFLRCSAFEKLMAGGNGAGKSLCLLAAAAAESSNPAMRSLVLRLSYPQLKDLIASSWMIYANMRAKFNVQQHQWTFPSGAIVEFGAIENTEQCILNFSGRSFSFIGVDEIVHLAADQTDHTGQPINGAYSFLKSRLRAVEGSNLSIQLASTGTPGGCGQAWIKSYFGIDSSGQSCETLDPITGTRRAYFFCTVQDNEVLRNTDYAARLRGLPEAQRKAFELGDWNSFVGQCLPEWNFNLHTCAEFEIPDSWQMWRGLDFGVASPACCLWAAHDPARDIVLITNEVYERGLLVTQLARAIQRIDERYGRNLDGVADSGCWADVGLGHEAGKGSPGDVLNSFGLRFKPASKGPGSRVAGLQLLHEKLAINKATGLPGLIIFRRCANTIRELPALTFDRSHPEDVDSECSDHAYDSLRYLLGRKKVSGGMTKIRWAH